MRELLESLRSASRQAIDQAVEECRQKGISGKAITPYLLDRIQRLTGGRSLESNIQLVYNNAALGAKIACALCKGA